MPFSRSCSPGFVSDKSAQVLSHFESNFPSSHAETAPESVIAETLQARSAKRPGKEKIFCAENNPKLIAVQKSMPRINPYFKPEPKLLAPDHFIAVVIRKPNARAETSNAQITS